MARTWNPSTIHSRIIVVSDRVLAGERENTAARNCADRIAAAGLPAPRIVVVPESRQPIEEAIGEALADGDRFVLTLGGSGLRPGNDAPEAARALIDVEIPGMAERIRAHGLAHAPTAPLCRGIVGVTARDRTGALVVVSPGSTGGASDALDVVLPLLEHVFAQLDEV